MPEVWKKFAMQTGIFMPAQAAHVLSKEAKKQKPLYGPSSLFAVGNLYCGLAGDKSSILLRCSFEPSASGPTTLKQAVKAVE